MKFIILQDIPYRRPEGALAQYHGAIWAEELRRRGHVATKMVVGDPATITPESPLLSLSTARQRTDPSFWRDQRADCVLYYANPSPDCVRVVRAIKSGSPATRVVSRIEAFWAPERWSVRRACNGFARRYVEARHCPTERFDRETRPVLSAVLRAAAGEVRRMVRNPAEEFLRLADASDATTFFFPKLVDEAKSFLNGRGRPDLAAKVRWAGYTVRHEFQPPANGVKRAHSVVSVANWRHFKDPELTADAMALVLSEVPDATFTVVGERSDRVADRIASARRPEVASRVHSFSHADNRTLPTWLSESQVFLLCSIREGIPSVLLEALCCGCSLALSTGPAVGSFREYLAGGTGSQAASRSPEDMAAAVLSEFRLWDCGTRNSDTLARHGNQSHVSALCDDLLSLVRNRQESTRIDKTIDKYHQST